MRKIQRKDSEGNWLPTKLDVSLLTRAELKRLRVTFGKHRNELWIEVPKDYIQNYVLQFSIEERRDNNNRQTLEIVEALIEHGLIDVSFPRIEPEVSIKSVDRLIDTMETLITEIRMLVQCLVRQPPTQQTVTVSPTISPTISNEIKVENSLLERAENLRKKKIENPRSHLTDEERRMFNELLAEGYDKTEIAKMTGMSRDAVKSLFKRMTRRSRN